MSTNVEGIIKIFANNPPTIAIAGGILLIIVAIPVYFASQVVYNQIMSWVPILIFGGIGLQVFWLLLKHKVIR